MGGLRACPEKERVYACLLAPALPLQALARSEPDLAGQPVAVAEGAGTSARILHVSRAARALGASPGMTPSQARSVAPEVRVRLVAPGVLEAAAQALVDAAFRFSPSVQALAPGVVVLDVRGTERLYPSRPGLGAAMQAAAERAGLKVRAGIAAGHRLAVLAARSGPGVTWIPRGRESELLGPLPVAVLGPSPPLRDTLARLGLDTVGALARLDGRGLGIRLGPEALDLYRLAKGDDPGSLTPIRPADVFEETVALDYVLDRAEPVLFRVSAALQRLAARLDDRHLAPSELRLGLDLEPEGVHGIRIRLPAPTPDLRSLLALVRIHLESHPPTAPVRGFSLQADGGLPVPSQGHLFGPPVPEPSRLAALMARLSALAGPENVGSPRAPCGRLAEPSEPAPFSPAPVPVPPEARAASARPLLALRRFTPPREVRVELREDLPAWIRGPDVGGRVLRVSGPWYADPAWWNGAGSGPGAFYDAEVAGAGILHLRHDLATDRWVAEGVYD